MSKAALITGIAGQDGSYLAELLLEKGYVVVGMLRRNSVPEHQSSRIDHLGDHIETFYGDVTDYSSIAGALMTRQVDELYNLASQSHVRISFDQPLWTAQVNGIGAVNVFEAVRNCSPHTRVYQASSSEMFGNSIDDDGYQRLTTPMHPVSPYGCAKLFAYKCAQHYRRAYGLHIVNGILFNHESPRRASNFVTAKIVKTAVQIKRGQVNELRLGNLDSQRDWGHSRDYVRAMWDIVQYHEARDWIVATGKARSVRHVCDYVFRALKLDYTKYVIQDPMYMRPEELRVLRGDSREIRKRLDWRLRVSFTGMLDEMIEHWWNVLDA